MEQPNFLNFFNELIQLYQGAERAVGLEKLQQKIPQSIAHLITGVSFVAMGYFAYQNSDKALLGCGATAGLIISFYDNQRVQTPQKGALLGMTNQDSFALQKIYLVATLLRKNYAIATGFFMANALVHAVLQPLLNNRIAATDPKRLFGDS